MSANKKQDDIVFTISELNQNAKLILEHQFNKIWITGEISNLVIPRSGHWYFSLKDEASQIKSVMFKPNNLYVPFDVADGQQLLAYGRVSLYTPRGDFQFIAEQLELAGEGALRRRFELLKQQLLAAGLFDQERELPAIPNCIGVITSATGAAIRDVLHVLRRRFPAIPIIIFPVLVQGKDAASSIVAGIEKANQQKQCDVLLLVRGGGSLEDLWSFNEETVAHAIYNSAVPIVVGVGHQTDITIADYVADVRAATPSAAAELVSPEQQEWLANCFDCLKYLVAQMENQLQQAMIQLITLKNQLQHPGVKLEEWGQRFDELDVRLQQLLSENLNVKNEQLQRLTNRLFQLTPLTELVRVEMHINNLLHRLQQSLQKIVQQAEMQLQQWVGQLQTLSPLTTLQRGYAIVQSESGQVIQESAQVELEQVIQVRLAQGKLACVVKNK